MTEYCIQNTKNSSKPSQFAVFCSFILSHPLYFSYLIFFSPYIIKLLSFLSPLFITTSLLFLSLVTTLVPLRSVINSKEGFFLTTYNTLLQKVCPNEKDENLREPIEECEVYKIVFEGSPIIEVLQENPDGFSEKKVIFEERETGDTKPNKVKEEVKKFESLSSRPGSEVIKKRISEGLKSSLGSLRVDDEKKVSEAFSQTVGSPPYLGSFGSMRKEKEWRRTLACKLFEERHNWSNNGVNGGVNCGEEGMDLLWETHETEENRGDKTVVEAKMKKMMMINDNNEDGYGNGDYEDDNDDDHGKVCCLQALKLSAGKMNLNMGRPNLIKIGKAFKGIGWLHSHVKRQGKKGYK